MSISETLMAQVFEGIRSAAAEHYSELLKDCRCPDHGSSIESVLVTGGRLTAGGIEDASVNIKGCCDRATEDAAALLQEASE